MIGLKREKQLLDWPINNPDAILQIMLSGRHISVNWTIIGRSSLCYLMIGLNLMKGRRLGPKGPISRTRMEPLQSDVPNIGCSVSLWVIHDIERTQSSPLWTKWTLPLVYVIYRIRFSIKTRWWKWKPFLCAMFQLYLCLQLQKVDKGDSTRHNTWKVWRHNMRNFFNFKNYSCLLRYRTQKRVSLA